MVNRILPELDGQIHMSWDDLDDQEHAEYNEIRIGELPLVPGYDATLVFTYKHEAPVTSVAFTVDSE